MKQRRPPIPLPKRPIATGFKQSSAALQANADKFTAALATHQQGQLDQAEAIYKEILQSQPQHFDALQLLATISGMAPSSFFFEQAACAGLLPTMIISRLIDNALQIHRDKNGPL